MTRRDILEILCDKCEILGSEKGQGIFIDQALIELEKLDLTEEELKKIIINWFVELEKEQSAEQIKEIDKKGLWCADLKSVSFDEIANNLAKAILSAKNRKEKSVEMP